MSKLAWPWPRRAALCFAVAGAALLAFLIWFVANLFAFGDARDRQGGKNFWCTNIVLPSVPNEGGWVVTAHRTECDTFGKDSMTYVYLRRTDWQDESYSLILRYDGGDPKIKWMDPRHVSITANNVSDLDKQVVRLWGITVTYDLQGYALAPSL